MSTKSPFIRLAPLHLSNLPSHPSFKDNTTRPDLLQLALTLLNQGRNLVLPQQFNLTFKHHSEKASQPSNNEVEILSTTVPASTLHTLPWDTSDLPRPKPALDDEHWYARRSYHHNISVKHNPGTASWDEFIYGLRDNRSKHEEDFTPTIYHANLVLEWNEALNTALIGSEYSAATMSVYEMCHEMPTPLSPRCFPVLVVTASVSENEFLAVTVPVDVATFEGAMYSNGRNRREGEGLRKKEVTVGRYCAVERVVRYKKEVKHQGHEHEGVGEEIEWVMATASHAKGKIPIGMQRMGVPGAVAKDVGLFLKWLRKVDDGEIVKQGVTTVDGSG